MKKVFLAVVFMVMFSGVACADIAETARIGCKHLAEGNLLDNHVNHPGQSDLDRFYSRRAAAKIGSELLKNKYGPLEGSFSDVSLGIGLKKGFTYESLITTYYDAMAEMTEAEVIGLLDVMSTNLEQEPGYSFTNRNAILTVAACFQGDLSLNMFVWWENVAFKRSGSFRAPAYKKLWVDLANSDSHQFVADVRKHMEGKSEFYKNLCQ